MTDTSVLTKKFEEFLQYLRGEPTAKDRLFLAAGLLELMRRSTSSDTLFAMAQFLASVPAEIKWSRIPFSLTQVLLGQKMKQKLAAAGISDQDMPQVLLAALLLFLAFVESDLDLVEDHLFLCAEDAAAEFLAAQRRPPETRGPELFTDSLVSRVFKTKPLTEATLTTLQAAAVCVQQDRKSTRLNSSHSSVSRMPSSA